MAVTEKTVYVTSDQKTFGDRHKAELHEGRLTLSRLFADLGPDPMAIVKAIEYHRATVADHLQAAGKVSSDSGRLPVATSAATPKAVAAVEEPAPVSVVPPPADEPSPLASNPLASPLAERNAPADRPVAEADSALEIKLPPAQSPSGKAPAASEMAPTAAEAAAISPRPPTAVIRPGQQYDAGEDEEAWAEAQDEDSGGHSTIANELDDPDSETVPPVESAAPSRRRPVRRRRR